MAKTLILILFTILLSCKSEKVKHPKEEYLRWIGDSQYKAEIDNPNFKICNGDDNIFQYFNLEQGPVYIGEKPTLLKTFKAKYKPLLNKNQNGLIRIRFVVNCEGLAGRFRVLQSDSNFNETKFDEKIVSQLTEITKEIEQWVVLYRDSEPIDYYYYLIFKIVDGQITEILP